MCWSVAKCLLNTAMTEANKPLTVFALHRADTEEGVGIFPFFGYSVQLNAFTLICAPLMSQCASIIIFSIDKFDYNKLIHCSNHFLVLFIPRLYMVITLYFIFTFMSYKVWWFNFNRKHKHESDE